MRAACNPISATASPAASLAIAASIKADTCEIYTDVDGIKAGLGDVGEAAVAVCPPYVYLPAVREQLEGTAVGLGAQDVSDQDSGAYTGEVSGAMLRDVGCDYVIVGHSERRMFNGETDAVIARTPKISDTYWLMEGLLNNIEREFA